MRAKEKKKAGKTSRTKQRDITFFFSWRVSDLREGPSL